MYAHCGTHDTLNHLGYYGCFWNGWTSDEHLGSRSWTVGGAEHYPPIFARGVLVDVARLHGVECIPDGYVIGPDEVEKAAREQRVGFRRGDIICIRTGRMTRWPDYDRYLLRPPGLNVAAARFLCEEAGAMCIAVDTIGIDPFPAENPDEFLPVHAYVFATAGAQIIEVVWMEEIAAARLVEFAFVGFALKLRGATGAPLRPVAIPLRA